MHTVVPGGLGPQVVSFGRNQLTHFLESMPIVGDLKDMRWVGDAQRGAREFRASAPRSGRISVCCAPRTRGVGGGVSLGRGRQGRGRTPCGFFPPPAAQPATCPN